MTPEAPRLSICIATFKRAAWIGETLRSILFQAPSDIEVVVVDGASPDATEETMHAFRDDARVHYFRENTNSGVDRDYDKAVEYARGTYCWLMTDDDVLLPGAVDSVLAACANRPALVVINAAVKDLDLRDTLNPALLSVRDDYRFEPGESEALFRKTAKFLSFIGALVVRRDLWLARRRSVYWGSAFAHVGVLFQAPLDAHAMVLAAPHVAIRYGNSMWSPQALEIWFSNWPRLVMGLDWMALSTRATVAEMSPGRFAKKLLMYRAIGRLDRSHLRGSPIAHLPAQHRLLAFLVASVPRAIAATVAALYCLTGAAGARMTAYDLAHAAKPARVSRWVAARLGVR